jgi:hypothetical protein
MQADRWGEATQHEHGVTRQPRTRGSRGSSSSVTSSSIACTDAQTHTAGAESVHHQRVDVRVRGQRTLDVTRSTDPRDGSGRHVEDVWQRLAARSSRQRRHGSQSGRAGASTQVAAG